MEKNIVVVDKDNNFIKLEEKMKVHELGLLHRAFSLLIFNSKNEMLIHKRASSKYHCPGLWTNACCSHPSLDNDIIFDIQKRLYEEMGMKAYKIKELFTFTYRKEFDNGLIENEIDRIFIAFSDEIPKPNPEEVDDYRYVNVKELYSDIKQNSDNYTYWFIEILNHEKFLEFVKKLKI
jgi:isopentenyl-diphosphate Delta-isomerase